MDNLCENSEDIIVNDSEFETMAVEGHDSFLQDKNLKGDEKIKYIEKNIDKQNILDTNIINSSFNRPTSSLLSSQIASTDIQSMCSSNGSSLSLEKRYKKFLEAARRGDNSLFIRILEDIYSCEKKKKDNNSVNGSETVRMSLAVNINYQDERGNTALHLACEEGNFKIVETLIKNQCDINIVNKNKKTALHLSAINGFFDISKMLILAGTDVSKQDKEKNTPLHYACMNNNIEIIKLILDNSKPNLTSSRNIFGKTPKELCISEEAKQLFNNLPKPSKSSKLTNPKILNDPTSLITKRSSQELRKTTNIINSNTKICKTAIKKNQVVTRMNDLLKTSKHLEIPLNKMKLENYFNLTTNINSKKVLKKEKKCNNVLLNKIFSNTKMQKKNDIEFENKLKNINMTKSKKNLNNSDYCYERNLNTECETSLNLSVSGRILSKLKMSPETKKLPIYKLTKKKSNVTLNRTLDSVNFKEKHKNKIIKKNCNENLIKRTNKNPNSVLKLNKSVDQRRELVKTSSATSLPVKRKKLYDTKVKTDEEKENISMMNPNSIMNTSIMSNLSKKEENKKAKNYLLESELDLNSIKEEEKIGTSSFICLGRLGKGSFGEVYLVEKINTKERYAMKVLRKEKVLRQNLIKYVVAERNILSISNHPYIVKLFYSFQTYSKLFLVLEYCPLGDLSVHLFFEKRLNEQRAKFYVCQVLLALEYLHKNDIIFRDLKPENVVLDSEGNAKLTDFGLSKEGVNEFAGARSFCGSVAYLAPEMLNKEGHGKAVDWYLLGVLFYELLVGVTPFFSYPQNSPFPPNYPYSLYSNELRFPNFISDTLRSLLRGLLARDPRVRLGGGPNDAADIKSHEYFSDVDWESLLAKKLPVPAAKDYRVRTVRYFRTPKLFAGDGDNKYKMTDDIKKEFKDIKNENDENIDNNIKISNNTDENNDKITDMNMTSIYFKKRNILPGWSFALKD